MNTDTGPSATFRAPTALVRSIYPALLLLSLLTAISLGAFLDQTARADRHLQLSPVSPLETEQAPTSVLDPSEAEVIPAAPEASTGSSAIEDPAPAAADLPLGEPLEAQTSLFLVGMVLAGLVLLVIFIVVKWRA